MISVSKVKLGLLFVFSFLMVSNLNAQGEVCDEFNQGGYIFPEGTGTFEEACIEAGGFWEPEPGVPGPGLCNCPTLDFNQSTVAFAVLGGLALGFMALRKRF